MDLDNSKLLHKQKENLPKRTKQSLKAITFYSRQSKSFNYIAFQRVVKLNGNIAQVLNNIRCHKKDYFCF